MRLLYFIVFALAFQGCGPRRFSGSWVYESDVAVNNPMSVHMQGGESVSTIEQRRLKALQEEQGSKP